MNKGSSEYNLPALPAGRQAAGRLRGTEPKELTAFRSKACLPAGRLRGIEPVLAPCLPARQARLGKLSEDNFRSLYVANKN